MGCRVLPEVITQGLEGLPVCCESAFCYLSLHIIGMFSLQIASPCRKEKEVFSSWLLVTEASSHSVFQATCHD